MSFTTLQGYRVNDFKAEYSPNLLPLMNGNIVVTDGSNANVTYDSNFSFDKQSSLKFTFTNVGQINRTNIYVDNLTYTCQKTGLYILSFRVFKQNPSTDINLYVQIFRQGVASTIVAQNIYQSSKFEDDNWNTYYQTFQCNQGEEISFRVEADSDESLEVLWVSAFKFEINNRILNGSPSYYTMPLQYCCASALVNSYEIKNSNYTITNLDSNIEASASSIVFTLPDATTNKGKYFTIDNNSNGSINVNTILSQLISGLDYAGTSSFTLNSQNVLEIVSNGVGYRLR